jgi:hypothetical protein
MYPTPASSYQSQIPQQLPQSIPQVMNQNSYPPPPSSSQPPPSSYPYPQPNYNANPAPFGHSGPPPLGPQTMPYTMGGSTAGVTSQQNNNLNGPLSVRISLIESFIPINLWGFCLSFIE